MSAEDIKAEIRKAFISAMMKPLVAFLSLVVALNATGVYLGYKSDKRLDERSLWMKAREQRDQEQTEAIRKLAENQRLLICMIKSHDTDEKCNVADFLK